MRIIMAFIINLSVLGYQAQYTYFNNVYGEFGDQESEIITAVEIIGDSIFIFGGIDNTKIETSLLSRIVDLNGNLINERIYSLNYGQLFLGLNHATCKTVDSQFLSVSIVSNDALTDSYSIMYDHNLDSIWTLLYYDSVPYSAEFRCCISVNEGFIIGGSNNEDIGEVGSFLTKLDLQGNLIWTTILREAEGEIYYNQYILEHSDGFLIGGYKRTGQDNAMLTKTDNEGNVEWEYFADNFVDDEGEVAETESFHLAELPNGDIVGGHMVWYEYYGDTPWSNTDPRWYRSLHLNKINVEDTSLYWQQDYLTNDEIKGGRLRKIIPTKDNGIVAIGYTSYYAENAWAIKIDSNGVQEWFNFYTLDISEEQESYEPFDIEQTSDGGFVVVGQHYNYALEGYTQSWVMKIDACGDVEWEGCNYVGIQESKKIQVDVYPNPSSDFIIVAGEELTAETQVVIYDILGNVVVDHLLGAGFRIDVSGLSSGLYQLVLIEEEVIRYSEKIVVN